MKQRIEISKEDDRILIAGILIKNGYTVRIVRERYNDKGVYHYFVEFEK